MMRRSNTNPPPPSTMTSRNNNVVSTSSNSTSNSKSLLIAAFLLFVTGMILFFLHQTRTTTHNNNLLNSNNNILASSLQKHDERDVIVVLTTGCSGVETELIEHTIQHGVSARGNGRPFTVLVLFVGGADLDDFYYFPNPNLKGRQINIKSYTDILNSIQPYQDRIRGIKYLAATIAKESCRHDIQWCTQSVVGTNALLRVMNKLFIVDPPSINYYYQPWLIFVTSSLSDMFDNNSEEEVITEYTHPQPKMKYGQLMLDIETLIEHWVHDTKTNAVVLRLPSGLYGSCYDDVYNTILCLLEVEEDIYNDVKWQKISSLIHELDAVQAILLTSDYLSRLDHDAGVYELFHIAAPTTTTAAAGSRSDESFYNINIIKHNGDNEDDEVNKNNVLPILQQGIIKVVGSDNCKGCHLNLYANTTTNSTRNTPENRFMRISIDKARRVLGYHPSRSFLVETKTIRYYIKTCYQDLSGNAVTVKDEYMSQKGVIIPISVN